MEDPHYFKTSLLYGHDTVSERGSPLMHFDRVRLVWLPLVIPIQLYLELIWGSQKDVNVITQ